MNFEVQEARDSAGELVGYRLAVGDHTALVFKDQEAMPGFRSGEKFVPAYGDEVVYWTAFSAGGAHGPG
jgi:hypothetical protein